jgi:LPXTG-motif cell wall-anchored protein
MSLTRRLAVGLPAAGVTAFAAFAFTGVPAMAATADAQGLAARPVVMASPCADSSRDACDYGSGATPGSDDSTAGDDAAVGSNSDDNGYGGAAPATTKTPGSGHTRGNSNGYGGVSPTTVPPTGNVDTVPPGGEAPETVSPTPATPGGGGVSPAGTLPVTGPSIPLTASLGGALVLAGAGAFWFTRRRRTA